MHDEPKRSKELAARERIRLAQVRVEVFQDLTINQHRHRLGSMNRETNGVDISNANTRIPTSEPSPRFSHPNTESVEIGIVVWSVRFIVVGRVWLSEVVERRSVQIVFGVV
jgi:hypothetical protein